MKKYIFLSVFLFLSICAFSQYVRNYSGAWFNPNGIIYIVKPIETDRTEIAEIIIDNMFRVIKEPEIGIVYELEETSWQLRHLEVINFPNRNVRVSDVLYADTSDARPIDIFGDRNFGRFNVTISQKNYILARRIYKIDRIENIQEGNTSEYIELVRELENSRLVVFNDSPNSQKYIFNDMKLLDFGPRIGDITSIYIENYNKNEAILIYNRRSSYFPYSNIYTIKLNYKIVYANPYPEFHLSN
jgi:hypothetical protein